MDGFQPATSAPSRSTGRRALSPDQAARIAWDKAMQRFQRSLAGIKTAMDAHAVVEQEMFAARRMLDELPYPACLTVVTEVEVYIKDGVQPPLHRKSSQETRLMTQADISAYAGEDEALYARMCDVLRDYCRHRGVLAGACQKAEAISDAKNTLSAHAISHSDAQQLRLLRTPAPTFKELCWKIETLHRADCNDDTERDGWAYVLEELAVLSGKAGDATLN